MRPRFVVIDDHDDLRHLLCQLLAPDMDCVGDADNGRDGLRLVTEQRPDLVILDLSMPDMDGLEVLRDLRAQGAQRVLVFSGYHNERLEEVVLAMGASRLLSKSAPVDDMIDAANAVAAGPVPPVTDDEVLRHARLRDLI